MGRRDAIHLQLQQRLRHARPRREAGSLPAGTYTIRYNTEVLTLEVPSQLATTPSLRMGG